MAKKYNDFFAGVETDQNLDESWMKPKGTLKNTNHQVRTTSQTKTLIGVILFFVFFFAVIVIGLIVFTFHGAVSLFESTRDVMTEQVENMNPSILPGTTMPPEIQNLLGNQRLHNAQFSTANGTKAGLFVRNFIDTVIDNNKKVEVGIGYGIYVSVVFNGIEMYDTTELKDIKLVIDNTAYYEVESEYDAEGFICQIIIDEL
ncbi:MAG: hypothetical protein FWG40_11505 [Peptococcaceae bacterium]|nr:hypothetical protein [Peptococcaceae bacterium]